MYQLPHDRMHGVFIIQCLLPALLSWLSVNINIHKMSMSTVMYNLNDGGPDVSIFCIELHACRMYVLWEWYSFCASISYVSWITLQALWHHLNSNTNIATLRTSVLAKRNWKTKQGGSDNWKKQSLMNHLKHYWHQVVMKLVSDSNNRAGYMLSAGGSRSLYRWP